MVDASAAERILHEVTKRVSLRTTHPNLYRMLMTIALMQSALAVNFYTSHPTFNPFGIPKAAIGSIFLVLGVSQLLVLNVYHRLILVRFIAAASMTVMAFWGASNLEQVFAGKASYQLPTLYFGLALLQWFLAIEPRINPITANGNGKKLIEKAS